MINYKIGDHIERKDKTMWGIIKSFPDDDTSHAYVKFFGPEAGIGLTCVKLTNYNKIKD